MAKYLYIKTTEGVFVLKNIKESIEILSDAIIFGNEITVNSKYFLGHKFV